jgi:NADP-dependent 3-hydroxy acid dehydrogenase YdfG
MATHWGTWSPQERSAEDPGGDPATALPPETVAEYITWLVTAPPELVLDEALVTPLREEGCP